MIVPLYKVPWSKIASFLSCHICFFECSSGSLPKWLCSSTGLFPWFSDNRISAWDNLGLIQGLGCQAEHQTGTRSSLPRLFRGCQADIILYEILLGTLVLTLWIYLCCGNIALSCNIYKIWWLCRTESAVATAALKGKFFLLTISKVDWSDGRERSSWESTLLLFAACVICFTYQHIPWYMGQSSSSSLSYDAVH